MYYLESKLPSLPGNQWATIQITQILKITAIARTYLTKRT